MNIIARSRLGSLEEISRLTADFSFSLKPPDHCVSAAAGVKLRGRADTALRYHKSQKRSIGWDNEWVISAGLAH